MRYLTGRGNVHCGMHLLRQISVGHLSGRGNVRPSEMCLVGEVSVGDVSGRGSVRWGCVWSGKCPSGMCLVGKVSVGEVSVGEESVRETSVGDVSGNQQVHALFLKSMCREYYHLHTWQNQYFLGIRKTYHIYKY